MKPQTKDVAIAQNYALDLLQEPQHAGDFYWGFAGERPDAGMTMISHQWSGHFRPVSNRSVEWYIDCALAGYDTLDEIAEVNPRKHGGVPVLKGTRFTVAQVLAELAETSAVHELADNFSLDDEKLHELLVALSQVLNRPPMR